MAPCARPAEVLGVHRVTIDPESANARAIRAYEKAGFRLEGLLRDADFIRGGYVDTHFMAILADDWPAAKAHWERERLLGEPAARDPQVLRDAH
ncbi:MAG: N-acetyltransferase [Dehalococcoidia bacterium]|nr:N-acetyltransferase [Dehalococcoidia bacterium]